jgi:hypothetical protein
VIEMIKENQMQGCREELEKGYDIYQESDFSILIKFINKKHVKTLCRTTDSGVFIYNISDAADLEAVTIFLQKTAFKELVK